MPLFFLLSGIFFSWKAEPREFLIKKSEALLKPYFTVLLTLLLLAAVIGEDELLSQLVGIFYGNGDTIRWTPLWFLTHLFVVYFFSYVLFHYLRFHFLSFKQKAGVLVVLLVVGILNIRLFWEAEYQLFGHSTQLPGLPFSIDILFITSVFFICGRILRDMLINFRPNVMVMVLCLVGFFIISIYTDAHIDFNKRVYNSPIYATMGAFIGIYIVLTISWYISKVELLSYVPIRFGEASLYILVFHQFIQLKIFYYLSKGVEENSTLIGISIISLLLSVIIPIGIKSIVLRSDILSLAFLPFRSNKLLQRLLYARR
jgi:fucose 4-O-acetylase-like acetyltransferase